MFSNPVERIGIFVDGANLSATTKALNFFCDFSALIGVFTNRHTYLVTANYYSAIYTDKNTDAQFLRPLMDYLSYNGWVVVSKPTKEFYDPIARSTRIKGNMDVELAVDVLRACDYVDKIILFSGDGDFKYLVEECQRRGKRVTVVSTIITRPSMVADELRKQANEFVDIASLIDRIRLVDVEKEHGRMGMA